MAKANFVLWNDGLNFFVTERVGVKRDSKFKEHFEGFFETEAEAYDVAIALTNQRIETLKSYIKHFKKLKKRG